MLQFHFLVNSLDMLGDSLIVKRKYYVRFSLSPLYYSSL